MGFLNLPAPLFDIVDTAATRILPPVVMLLVWAAVAAVLSMEVYRVLSPQARITGLKTRLNETQRELSDYDGEFEGAWPIIRRMLSLALRRVGIVLPASIAASLPLLMLIVWLDSSYAYEYPPAGEPVAVSAPGQFEGQWEGAEPVPRARVTDDSGEIVVEVPVEAPIPVIHKRRWWNVMLGNPAGYLDDDAPFDAIDLDLPRREMVSAGPSWARRWEVVFFPALVVMAIGFKMARRIE